MGQTYKFTQGEMTAMECPSCGVLYGLSESYRTKRKSDGAWWHCPNGHSLHYHDTAEQMARKAAERRAEAAEAEANRQKNAREWAERRAKGANIAAGKAKAAQRRLLHRVECGVCPHCQRTFKQLAAHIRSKHKVAARRVE